MICICENKDTQHFDFEGSVVLRLAVLKSDDAKFQNWWHIEEL